MDDWLHPNPDRNALSPYSMAECYDSKSSLNGTFLKPSVASLQGWGPGIHASKELPMESSWYSFSSSCSPSGLAQRIAAKAGFDDLTLDTSQMKQMASLPSPLLTIPPGLSPTTLLLDSPVFISNSMAEQYSMMSNSPFLECSNPGESDVGNKINDHLLEDIDLPSFACKLPQPYLTTADKKPALSMHQQSIAIQGTSNQSHLQPILHHEFSRPPNGKANSADDALLDKKASNNSTGNERSALLDEPREGELSSASLGDSSEDGYAWRKYGQKQVKGSEFPRSYYKCTHPNCQVKKKVERSHIGHITEIVYKGVHNHLKPPSSCRASFPLCQSANIMQIDGSEQNRTVDLDWKNDGFVANQSASASIEQFDQYSTFQAEGGPQHETPDGIDVSSTLSNDDDEEDDQVTHASVTLGTEGDGDETEPKRRKLDVCALEMSSGSRGVREPRVVVQTTSDVDILDDGYRWRKYGQKVVKGNPNPRSYYKCTNPGCTVRKHIERASHDLKSVITTYEGKHNHEVPAARTSSNQTNSSSNSSTITTTTTTAPPSVLPRKAEPARMPDALGRLDVIGPLGCFGFHARGQQLGATGPSFSVAMEHQGLSQNFAMAGLGQMASLKMPVLPQLPAYMAHHGQGSSIGFMMPKGVTMEAATAEAGSPISGGSAAYQQLMKMHLGPQM